MNIGIATVGPIDQARHRVQQGLAQRGKAIFNARRLGRKDMAGDQSVALQVAQRLGEHAPSSGISWRSFGPSLRRRPSPPRNYHTAPRLALAWPWQPTLGAAASW